ncbi:MAG: FAD-binding protein, partial [Candidatus Bathyarchaeia archaeon]
SELETLAEKVDSIYLKFGAPNRLYGTDLDAVDEIRRKASLAGLSLIPVKLRHLGTEKCTEVLRAMRDYLKPRVEMRTRTDVAHLIVKDGRVEGVTTNKDEMFSARHVILAPGRSGSEWLLSEGRRLGLQTVTNPVDLGVRVEVPAPVMDDLAQVLYEPKFVYYSKSFDDKVRLFCACPNGEVITELYDDVLTVNGQSYAEKKTQNTNFAVLVSTAFTEPFKEPIAYAKYIARLANIIGGGVIVQRLGDVKRGRRSTRERIERSIVNPTLKTATPGDLSYVLPYRYLSDILEMLEAMDKVSPGVYSDHTLLYGVEVKFYSSRPELNEHLETPVKGLYAAGDGAGVTRSLVQASMSGIIAAQGILNNETAA